MYRLSDLSFRFKIPLRASLLVFVTAAAVTASLMFREYDALRLDLASASANLGRLLAKTLVTPLTHDDLWRAFEIINAPFQTRPTQHSFQEPKVVLVLSPQQQVYVSTEPQQYPVLSDPGRVNPDMYAIGEAAARLPDGEPRTIELPDSNTIYTVTPIIADGVVLGNLIMGYSKDLFAVRFAAIARRATVTTFVVMALLLPASWLWASRFAKPMVQLAHAMATVGTKIPEDADIAVEESRDELGQVGTAFKRMLTELREKEAIKREMVVSERLAALGRLSAGIAHEINNPLGGMLNAIDTFKHHATPDAVSSRTMALLERGLLQIRDTVAALLVEARVDSHPLSRDDIEDVHTLVKADAQRKRATLAWENDIVDPLPFKANLVRQILLNLLLNGLQAIEERGNVACHVYRDSSTLHLVVRNDGAHIPPEQADFLFEPFASNREAGHGLGLWVTYQIVTQLGGEIVVESTPGDTRFVVRLPIPPSDR